jgi:hypothetical protein
MRFSHTPPLTGDLEHWQYDTFLVRWRDRALRADAFVTFQLHPDGSIDRVRMGLPRRTSISATTSRTSISSPRQGKDPSHSPSARRGHHLT